MAEIANSSIDIEVVDSDNVTKQFFWFQGEAEYFLTEDEEVVAGKTYYAKVGDEYEAVTPVGNEDPSAQGWYELFLDLGAHITQVPKEEFIPNPEDGGGNTLNDGDGFQIRNGMTSVARFSGDMARIGQEDSARTEITPRGFRVVTDENIGAFNIDSSGGTELVYVELSNDTPMDVSVNYAAGQTIANFDEIIAGVEVGNGVKVSVVAEVIEYYYDTTDGRKQKASKVVQTTSFTFDITKGTSMSKAVSGIKGTTDIYSNDNTTLVSTFNYDGTTDALTYSSRPGMARFQSFSTTHRFYTKVHLVISGQVETSIPATKMNSEVSFLMPEKVFVVESYSHSYSKISSGDTLSWEQTITKEGYYPVGVVGFRTGRAALVTNAARIVDRQVGQCGLYMNARAVATASAATAYMHVLWVKAE